MFKKIITYKGFWKSVLFVSLLAMIVFFIITWGTTGFNKGFLQVSPRTILAMVVGGFIYGLITTYGKYWAKLKSQEHRNR